MSWIQKLLSLKKPGTRASLAVAERANDSRRPGWITSPKLTAGLPHFQTTAADRLDPRMSDRLAGVRMRLRTGFTPSLPVTDAELFAGRTEVLNTVIRAIEDQRLHVVLYGERGIGKTSLLHVLTQLAQDARYLVVYVSCGAGSNFDEMVRQVADEIPLRFHGQFGPTAEGAEAGAAFASLLPANAQVSVRIATDLFSKIAGSRVLVILDEFDRSQSPEFRRAMAELLKSLSDRAVRLQVVIAGVAADLTELVEHVPSIQRNIFALRLPKMEPAEIRTLLKKGGEHGGLTFSSQAEAAIVGSSAGVPYLASLISYLSGSRAIDAGRANVDVEDVAGALDDALAELRGRISKRSQAKVEESAREGAHAILGALAGRAQVSAGLFNMDDVRAIYPNRQQSAKCEKLLDGYAVPRGLLELIEDDEGRAYRFREESVMPYVWLLYARALITSNANSEEPPPPVLESANG